MITRIRYKNKEHQFYKDLKNFILENKLPLQEIQSDTLSNEIEFLIFGRIYTFQNFEKERFQKTMNFLRKQKG